MCILSKFFRKRQPQKSCDEFKVIIKTKKNLSAKQKNAIITIVKKGIISGAQFSDIAINIMMSTEIYEMIILTRIEDGVEVII